MNNWHFTAKYRCKRFGETGIWADLVTVNLLWQKTDRQKNELKTQRVTDWIGFRTSGSTFAQKTFSFIHDDSEFFCYRHCRRCCRCCHCRCGFFVTLSSLLSLLRSFSSLLLLLFWHCCRCCHCRRCCCHCVAALTATIAVVVVSCCCCYCCQYCCHCYCYSFHCGFLYCCNHC